jgi:hypothetical protein
MHETIKFYVTVRFALSGKLALKTPNVLIKNVVFRCFCAIFQNDRRSVAVRYGALKNSDKFALLIVYTFLVILNCSKRTANAAFVSVRIYPKGFASIFLEQRMQAFTRYLQMITFTNAYERFANTRERCVRPSFWVVTNGQNIR